MLPGFEALEFKDFQGALQKPFLDRPTTHILRNIQVQC